MMRIEADVRSVGRGFIDGNARGASMKRAGGAVAAALCAALLAMGAAPGGQPSAASTAVKKAEIPGIRNFSMLESPGAYGGDRVGFGGATQPSAMAALKKEGFASVINLRLASEEGSDVEAGREAARRAGLAYLHIPFSPAQPESGAVERFLDALGAAANQPAFIHCSSGNRVAALWMIKRVLKDGWPIDRAREEAVAIGLSTPPAEKFAVDYIAARRR